MAVSSSTPPANLEYVVAGGGRVVPLPGGITLTSASQALLVNNTDPTIYKLLADGDLVAATSAQISAAQAMPTVPAAIASGTVIGGGYSVGASSRTSGGYTEGAGSSGGSPFSSGVVSSVVSAGGTAPSGVVSGGSVSSGTVNGVVSAGGTESGVSSGGSVSSGTVTSTTSAGS